MGVTNLEGNQGDTHAKLAAVFAMDLVREASEILVDDDDPEKGYINVRVGFHSGPVVSNVIGSLNPRYGLFGDTVNTANRMESNSKAGRIMCSESAYKILHAQAPEVPVKRRGRIAVKGKGDMNVFWVGQPVGDSSKHIRAETQLDELALEKKMVQFSDASSAASDEDDAEKLNERLWRKKMQAELQRFDDDAASDAPVEQALPSKPKTHSLLPARLGRNEAKSKG